MIEIWLKTCFWLIVISFAFVGLAQFGGGFGASPGLGLIFILISAAMVWKYTEPERKAQQEKKRAESQKKWEIQQESVRRQEELLRQQELEKTLSEQKKTASKDLAKTQLRNYINEILDYVLMIPSKEGNDMPLSAINDSINNILADSNIKSEHFEESSIQNDKKIILEHLDECGLSNHLVVKRLRSLFSAKGN